MNDYLIAQLANGLVVGIIYAVIAAGLTIIFSILKIVNFAHGEIYMVGGYFAYFAIAFLGLSPFAALPVAMLGAFLLALVIEWAVLAPIHDPRTERKGDYGVLATFGVSILLRNAAVVVFGAYPLRPPSFVPGALVVGSVVLAWDRVVAAGAGCLMLACLLWFLNFTRTGEALRAVAQSREAASIVGIDATRFYQLAFGLGAALAAGAGALVGPIYSLSPSMGMLPDTQAFAIVVLGGMGSLSGSIVAGVLIGLAESLFVAFFPDPGRALTYAQAFSLLVLMAVLLFRPTGLFGRTATALE